MFETLKEKIGNGEKIVIILLALLLIGAAVWRGAGQNRTAPELVKSGFEEPLNPVLESVEITVHLIGAVNKPGIYHLPEGSRVYELLELAGGVSPEADQQAINQARPLFDGEQIYIAGAETGAAPGERVTIVENSSVKININTAGTAELTTLPGIGDVRAGQIVAYREKNGYFKDPRELMDVSGIGEKTYENIADLITVY
jgi:competence protein ComEA